MKDPLRDAALEYHRLPTPGKISIIPTKAMATQRDLSLAYSPGVAYACEEIEKDPLKALDYTSRGNLVAVITNGTAVLGLGDIGALAAKLVEYKYDLRQIVRDVCNSAAYQRTTRANESNEGDRQHFSHAIHVGYQPFQIV